MEQLLYNEKRKIIAKVEILENEIEMKWDWELEGKRDL